MFRFSFDPIFGSYAIVAGIFVVLALVLRVTKPEGDRLIGRWGRFLRLLRLLALLLLVFAALRPAIVYTKTERLASTLNILLDQSESMSRPDEAGESTRFQAAENSLLDIQPQLKRLGFHTEINAFAFDSKLHPLAVRDGMIEDIPDQPKGKETAIGDALDAVRERSSGKRVLATILFSDGNQRTGPMRDILPHDAAVRLRDAGIPLYAVCLGRPSGTPDIQDIAINDVQTNDRVFVKNELQMTALIRVTGFKNQRIPVQLLFEDEDGKMQPVAEQFVMATDEGQIVSCRFSFIPTKIGYYKYTVQVPPQPKELIDTNNSRSGFVRVIDGGLNVLFIQGERRYEQRPLRQSLDASTDIHVDYRALRVGRVAVVEGGKSSLQRRLEQFTQTRPDWTEDAFAPGKYNVYVLDDLDAAAFKPSELQALRERVREGCGLIMLGGYHAFGAGGYADTPLAEVSPVELSTLDRQPPDAPIRRDIHWPGPLSMLPTDSGRGQYVMRLASNPVKNEEIWKSLPPLDGANRFDKLKPGTLALAQGPQGQPLLVSHLFGLGRVLAFAGDSTYRWRLAGFVEEHKRFWRQIVLWLAKMEGALEGDCWITLDNTRLFPGEAAKFQVFLQSSEGEELRNFKAEAVVQKPDGSEDSVPLVDEDGIPTGSFRSTETPGDYTIRVEAFSDTLTETASRKATARFMVFDQDLELDNPVAYPKLMETISETTGGRGLAPEQLGSLLDELSKRADELVEKRESKRTLYDSPWLLALFVALLGLEWFLRKHRGLV